MKTAKEIEKLAFDTILSEQGKLGFVKVFTIEEIIKNSPNPKIIDSMAMKYRHDFGLLDKQQQDSIRTTMIQLWEEVVGKGFY